jgi:5,10-methylene-tetrahydrofolate dehydrogenase/methenyl tetrahydrofolate cyclohydrolase
MQTERTSGAGTEGLRARVDALYLNYIFPVLATLRVGEDPAACALEQELLSAAKAARILVRRYILPADAPVADAEELVREVNADFLLSALLLIRPLPEALDPHALEEQLRPEKRIAAPVPAGEDPILTLLSRVADAAERSAK